MTVEVFSPCWNEERILPLYLEWYGFADAIHLFDGGSEDRTLEIAAGNPKVTMDTGRGRHDDDIDRRVNIEVMNTCWKGCRADWIIVCAVDEFLYHPNGVRSVLADAKQLGVTIPNVTGYDMICEKFPESLRELPRRGAPEPLHNKRIVFDPSKVAPNYGAGCHSCSPAGVVVPGSVTFTSLHMRYLGLEYFTARNQNQTRQTGTNATAWTPEISRQRFNALLASAVEVIPSWD